MSGNATISGVRTGQADFSLAVFPAIAMASFVVGGFVGKFLTHRVLYGLVAALLIITLLLPHGAMFTNVMIALLGFGMGMVNPTLSPIGHEPVGITAITGSLSAIGSHLALALRRAPLLGSKGPWDTHLYRAGIAAQLWASFVCGAALSGVVLSYTISLALVPAVVMMLVLASVSRSRELPVEALTIHQPREP